MKFLAAHLVTLIFCISLSPRSFAEPPLVRDTNLTAFQVDALARAARVEGDLEWQVLTAEVAGRPKTVVLLGESHAAFPRDLEVARRTFEHFDQFAVENGGIHKEARYNYKLAPLAVALMIPATLLTHLLDGRLAYSPMDLPGEYGSHKTVRNAEILHRPTVGEELDLAFLGAASAGQVVSAGFALRSLWRMVRHGRVRGHATGLLTAAGAYLGLRIAARLWERQAYDRPLLKNRDVDIAQFIDQWVRDPANDEVLVVIVGRMHLKNLRQFLMRDYHFRATAPESEVLSAIGF